MDPFTLDEPRTEMDLLNHRFLYFIDAEDGRGKVLYLRHDGDYGWSSRGTRRSAPPPGRRPAHRS